MEPSPPPPQGNVSGGMKFAAEDVFDPEFREWMQADPRGAMSSRGVDMDPDMDIRVHVNTDDTFHLAFPPDPNVALSDEALGVVAGGKTASSAGCAGSASTLGCLASTVSTATTASTIATVASAGGGS